MATTTKSAVSVVKEIVKSDKELVFAALGVRDEGVGVAVIMSLFEHSDSLILRLGKRGFVHASSDYENRTSDIVAMHFRKPEEFLHGGETYSRDGIVEMVQIEK